jgi:hypothetical protein
MRSFTLPFLDLAIGEMQKPSHGPAHAWDIMSEQCKSNWQHPDAYYRQRKETQHSAATQRDTSRRPQPCRMLLPKAAEITADPEGDVILEAVHFLVEIGNPRHLRSSGIGSIRSHGGH